MGKLTIINNQHACFYSADNSVIADFFVISSNIPLLSILLLSSFLASSINKQSHQTNNLVCDSGKAQGRYQLRFSYQHSALLGEYLLHYQHSNKDIQGCKHSSTCQAYAMTGWMSWSIFEREEKAFCAYLTNKSLNENQTLCIVTKRAKKR